MNALARVRSTQMADSCVVRVSGEVDLSNVHDVMDAISAAVPHDATRVILDLTAMSYVDSAGIAMVFRLAERLAHRRQVLRLVVPGTSPIRSVLELTNVPRVVPVDESVAEASEHA